MHDIRQALADVCSGYPALLPPNRKPVAEGVGEILHINRPGGGTGQWRAAETPYMVKPMNTLASRRHAAVCFCGPAQTGKTVGLVDGWMAHAVVNDPGDMLIVQMTQDKAREYSKQRIDRAIRSSPKLKALQSRKATDDNTHDKLFANGMWVRLAWPTATNMASTSYRYTAGTDYDRWPDDIDGEGDGFTLMGKRTTTFGSRGMTMVESSPGRPITDPTWRPATPHEAPPVGGILGIYNTSDRQRLYWQCPHCRAPFEAQPGLGLFRLPSDDELLETIRSLDIDRFARQHARIPCGECGALIMPSQRDQMQREAVARGDLGWLAEGLVLDEHGKVSGNPRTSSIAGFWLGGVAATYVTWESLIRKHLQALLDFHLTGDELKLMTTANTDQGIPYTSRALAETRDSAKASRFDGDLQRYVVPDWTRFVVRTVDVQGGRNARFVVQVMAIGEHLESALVDRFEITKSKREGYDGRPAPIDPAAYKEDWDVLTDQLPVTYRTSLEDVEVKAHLTVVDTGGEDGVSEAAYAWWRRLKKANLHRQVMLSKGDKENKKADWMIRETMVGQKQGKGDVPLQLLNANKFKDIVNHNLGRATPGPGYYHFPEPISPANPDGWLAQTFFDELKAEVRLETGQWSQVKPRNESFDLCYMTRAGCMLLGCDKKGFWDSPPHWALPLLDGNSNVTRAEVRRAERAAGDPPAPVPRRSVSTERRVGHSPYLG